MNLRRSSFACMCSSCVNTQAAGPAEVPPLNASPLAHDRIGLFIGRMPRARTSGEERRSTEPGLMLRVPGDHPKLEASSALVRSAWQLIWTGLQSVGFELVPGASRDGFSVRRTTGTQFRVDPKLETLRIRIGSHPDVTPPAELVHNGRQPNWIVVMPEHAALALRYLQQLT